MQMILIKANRLKFHARNTSKQLRQYNVASTDKDQDSGSYGGICTHISHDIEVDKYYGLHSEIPSSHYAASGVDPQKL